MKDPLSITHPALAAQWHPTKNGNLTPDQLVAGSNKKVWWICPKSFDHEWEAQLSKRTRRGDGCPFCGGKKPSVTNSLAGRYPELAREWHPAKNGTLTPDKVVAGSHTKAWWLCSHDSEHDSPSSGSWLKQESLVEMCQEF